MKRAVWLVFSVLLATVAGGQQNRILQTHERDILDARTIAVVAYSSQSAGADAQENQRARLAVQEALLRWRRYQVAEATVADLIVLVRKGHAQAATIGGTTGTPAVVLGPLDSGVGISIHHGENPPLSRTDPSHQLLRWAHHQSDLWARGGADAGRAAICRHEGSNRSIHP